MAKIVTQAIVFDQGNTLIMDPFRKILEGKKEEFIARFEDYGIQMNTQRMMEAWVKANGEVDYPHIGHFFQEEPIVQHALRELEIPTEIAVFLGLDLLKAYRMGYREVIDSDPRTEEVRRTLVELTGRGKRLGVFSNDRILSLGNTLRCMGIDSYFEYIQTSESIGLEKPDPRVFEHILDHFRLPPDQITYVGDDPARDIQGAKRKGLNVILYSVNRHLYGQTWRNYGAKTRHAPDAIIDDFADLLEVIA
jgi:putative hydrolase of the HAD superfamily